MPTKKKTGKQTAVEQLILAQLSQLNKRVGDLQREVTALDEQWDERFAEIKEAAEHRNTAPQKSAWPDVDTDEEPVPLPASPVNETKQDMLSALPKDIKVDVGWPAKMLLRARLREVLRALGPTERNRVVTSLRNLHTRWTETSIDKSVAIHSSEWPRPFKLADDLLLGDPRQDVEAGEYLSLKTIFGLCFKNVAVATDADADLHVLYQTEK